MERRDHHHGELQALCRVNGHDAHGVPTVGACRSLAGLRLGTDLLVQEAQECHRSFGAPQLELPYLVQELLDVGHSLFSRGKGRVGRPCAPLVQCARDQPVEWKPIELQTPPL